MPSSSFPKPFNTVKRFKNLFRTIFCLVLFQTANSQTINPTTLPTIGITPLPTLGLTPNPTLGVPPTATPTPLPATPTPLPYATPTPINGKVTPTNTPMATGFLRSLYFDSNFFNPLQSPLGIHFKMDSDGQAKVLVFNMRGEEVLRLLNEYKPAGTYNLSWNGHNQLNTLVGNGVYLVVLETPAGSTIQKVIVLK